MHFKLIIAFVEDSVTDAVLEATRRAGATGSTVINQARGEGVEKTRTFLGLNLDTQRDVLLLLVEADRGPAVLLDRLVAASNAELDIRALRGPRESTARDSAVPTIRVAVQWTPPPGEANLDPARFQYA